MNTSSIRVTRKKAALMGSVCAAVIVTGLAGSKTFSINPAMAADADIVIANGSYDAQASGSTALSSDVLNTDDIRAELTNNTLVLTTNGTTQSNDPNAIGSNINSDLEVDSNTVTATAIGNEINSSSDLITDNNNGSGVGIASVMLNDPGARVSSQVSSNQVGYGLGTTTGDVLNSDVSTSLNQLTASTTLNDARTIVDDTTGGLAGEVINSDTAGRVEFDARSSATNPVSAQGTIAVANSQLNLDPAGISDPDGLAGSSAVVAENTLGFAIDVTTNNGSANATGQFTVDSNRLAAEFRGNDYLLPAEDTVQSNDQDRPGVGVVASSATSFEGSIAVANQQINSYIADPVDGDGSVPAVASVQNNDIIGDFTDSSTATSILDGAVSVTGNTLAADGIGNRGLTFIEFNANTDLVGADGGADVAAETTVGTGLVFAEPTETLADLALTNQQVNSPFTTSSASIGNDIGVIFDDIAAGNNGDGSAIAVDQNQISAASSGNVGTNEISAGVTGGGNQIDATAALSSSQLNGRRATAATGGAAGVVNSADTTAQVENATIGIRSTEFTETTLDSNDLDVIANAVTADATGNNVANTINLSAATNLTTGDSSASVDGGFNLTSDAANVAPTASGGTVLSNTQGLINSLTDADVTNATIGATIVAEGDAIGTNIMVGGDNLDGTVDAEGNATYSQSELARIAASATGQTAVNDLTLSSGGGTLTGSAALNSSQIQGGQDANSFIGTRAEVTGSTIGAKLFLTGADTNFAQSSMSVTRSEVSATARGSTVSNNVTVTAANTLDYSPTNPVNGNAAIDLEDNGDSQVTPEITATGAAILANTQISNARTLADVEDIKVGTTLDGDVDNSSIMVDFNQVRADAIGNLVASQSPGNSLTIDAQTLQIAGSVTGTIGTIANVQDLTGRPGTTTDVQASVDDVFFDNDVTGDATNATLNSSSNTLTAVARGNFTMENFLNVTGGDISYAGGTQESSMILGLETLGTQDMSPIDVDIDSSAGFVIANVQRGSVDGVSATVGLGEGVGADVTVEGSVAGSNNDITSSSIDVSSNRFEALAQDNTAANTIRFGETEANGGAPVNTLATTSSIMNQQIAAGSTTATLGQAATAGTTDGVFELGGVNAQDPAFATPTIIADIAGNITDTSVDVSSNVNSAIARANDVTNTLVSEATTLTGDTDITPLRAGVSVADDANNVVAIGTTADDQVSNLQTRDPDAVVNATAFAGVGISTSIEESPGNPDILRSELTVDNNILAATAEGNVATNVVSAEAGTIGISAGGNSNMTSALSNVQMSLAGGSAIAGKEATDDFVADLFAPMAVNDSSVSISDNTTQSSTTLNLASNAVDISGTNVLSLAENTPPAQSLFNVETAMSTGGFSFGELTSNGQATLSNAQIASEQDSNDVASASTVMNIGNTDALVADTNGLIDSSIMVDDNRAQATVSANAATNTLSQNGDASLNATSVLSNVQYGDIGVDADSRLDARLDLSGGTATNPVHDNSSVSMTGNVNIASGTSNEVQNRVEISGTNVTGTVLPQGSGFAFIGDLDDNVAAGPFDDVEAFDSGAIGSIVSTSRQYSDADVEVDAITNILHRDTAQQSGISTTSMVQDNNLTIAEATGNLSGPNTRRTQQEQEARIFRDTIEVTGTNIGGATAALSFQEGNGNISATATTDIVNDMIGQQLLNSDVSISGNQTAAYATQNDATMSVIVDGSSIDGVETDTFAGTGDGSLPLGNTNVDLVGQTAVGDNVILGKQRSIGETVDSDVFVTLRASQDGSAGAADPAVDGSSLSIANNVAESSAAGNRASYGLTLNAATTLSATGAVSNDQFNTASVDATAVLDARIENGPDLSGTENMSDSSASIASNTVVARARGNIGTNALNVAAGSGIATDTDIGGATTGTASGAPGIATNTVGLTAGTLARADYVVMSAQENTAPINAYIGSGSGTNPVGEVLNTGSVTSSSINVSGNVMVASAVANSATNRMVSTSMNNASTTYGMANSQVNSGNVTSSITGASYGVSAGQMNGSAGAVSGNSLSARSVGNSAVNSIGRN